mgnify:CR=1 FL=1
MDKQNKFEFKEEDSLIIRQEFKDSIKIEGYTEKGKYIFEYKKWEEQ